MQRLQAEIFSDGRIRHTQEGRVRDLQEEVLLRSLQEAARLDGSLWLSQSRCQGVQVPEPAENVPRTVMTFEKSYINFGTVREGQVVEKKYTFKNTGDVPLTILNAQGSCGCTVPEWPKNEIPPGGVGTIRVRFNTLGKPGKRSQNVVITANTNPAKTTLTLQGVVEKDR